MNSFSTLRDFHSNDSIFSMWCEKWTRHTSWNEFFFFNFNVELLFSHSWKQISFRHGWHMRMQKKRSERERAKLINSRWVMCRHLGWLGLFGERVVARHTTINLLALQSNEINETIVMDGQMMNLSNSSKIWRNQYNKSERYSQKFMKREESV
jgi:hypothetical protein